ncbi:MAG: UDP-3-O-acyl-N-acetylglucosamine deacetylase [Pseudomonadota bacterium]
MFQCTIGTTVGATGVGVHSGNQVSVTFRPAPEDFGVVFRRVGGQAGPVDIPALSDYVCDTRFCTTLVKEGERVATVEHLLSAVAGLGIDNLIIEVNAPEIPIMDGSASPFVFLLQSAGIQTQQKKRQYIRILNPVSVTENDKSAGLFPHHGFAVDFTIDFDHPLIRASGQSLKTDLSPARYIKEISRARTFGFISDFEKLQAHQLALGASLDNTIGLDETQVLNEGGLRFEDEFVRHKILDAIGDLFLLGHRIIGRFIGHKSGHGLNNQLVRALLNQPDAYELITLSELDAPQATPIARQASPQHRIAES